MSEIVRFSVSLEDDLLEQFDRYLPKPPLPDRNSATMLGKTPVSEVQHPDVVLHPRNGPSTRECCGVAPCTREKPDLDAINREFAFAAEADAKHAEPVVLAAEDDSELIL